MYLIMSPYQNAHFYVIEGSTAHYVARVDLDLSILLLQQGLLVYTTKPGNIFVFRYQLKLI
jgi:hypothetical protein